MKQICFALLSALIFHTSAYAYTATFIGNGYWSDASQWENGQKGYLSLDTVIIKGNCIFDNSATYLDPDNGHLIIETGGTFTMSYTSTIFHVNDPIIVRGTFINNGIMSFSLAVELYVSGQFINNATIGFARIIIDGGSFVNSSTGDFGSNGVEMTNNGKFYNYGKIRGTGTFQGGDIINSNILAPGNSPGEIDITGDYTADATAIHNFEVAGTSSGSYDLLKVSGNLNLDGTLNVTLLGGFTPVAGVDIPIMSGTVNGHFSQVNLPAGYYLVYNSNGIVLSTAQPLPVTFVNLVATKVTSGVQLTWRVESELNTSNYQIEKSFDGQHFQSIGSVKAENRSLYQYVDPIVTTSAFYRIKSIDFDNSFNYTAIVNWKNNQTEVLFNLYPSLVHNKITIQHQTATANTYIRIYNSIGVLEKVQLINAGSQQSEVDLSSLQPGIHILLLLEKGNVKQRAKFIKQNL